MSGHCIVLHAIDIHSQEWVRILRDREILIPVHVDTKENWADIFTKILDTPTFVHIRSKLMYERKP